MTEQHSLNKNKGFISKKQVGVSGWKLLRGNIRSKGRFWLNRPDRILAKGTPV